MFIINLSSINVLYIYIYIVLIIKNITIKYCRTNNKKKNVYVTD